MEAKIEARPRERSLSHAKMTALYQRAGLSSPVVSRCERGAGLAGWLALALGSYGTDIVGEALQQLVEDVGVLRAAVPQLEDDVTADALIRISMRLGVVAEMHEALLVAACSEDDQWRREEMARKCLVAAGDAMAGLWSALGDAAIALEENEDNPVRTAAALLTVAAHVRRVEREVDEARQDLHSPDGVDATAGSEVRQ